MKAPPSSSSTPLPWQLDKIEFFRVVGTRQGQHALYHKLVIVTQKGGRGRQTPIDTDSAREFYEKWIRSGKGSEVPRLLSERRPRR